MSDNNLREADRKIFVQKINEALGYLRMARDVNEKWEFINTEKFDEVYGAVASMPTDANVGEKEIL